MSIGFSCATSVGDLRLLLGGCWHRILLLDALRTVGLPVFGSPSWHWYLRLRLLRTAGFERFFNLRRNLSEILSLWDFDNDFMSM